MSACCAPILGIRQSTSAVLEADILRSEASVGDGWLNEPASREGCGVLMNE
jgi:hypothetical protein